MTRQKADRPEQIRELRRQGLSVSEISDRLGISRQTVWRHTRSLEPVPPTPAPSESNGRVDLETARDVGLNTLLARARNGSVSAASSVFKIASSELRADKCQNHISKEDVVRALHAQFDLWVGHLQGPFVRRLLLEYDLDPGQVEGLISDSISDIVKELNARFESSEENTHA